MGSFRSNCSGGENCEEMSVENFPGVKMLRLGIVLEDVQGKCLGECLDRGAQLQVPTCSGVEPILK